MWYLIALGLLVTVVGWVAMSVVETSTQVGRLVVLCDNFC